MKSKFTKIWVILFLVVCVVLIFRFILAQNNQPTLEQVLKNNRSVDLSMVITSLLALSLATMSAAKGYEVLKRSQPMADVMLEEKPADEYHDEKIAELDFMVKELSRETERVKAESEMISRDNEELKNQIKKAALEYMEINKVEQMLRKSNITLSKEYETLKLENEKLQVVEKTAVKPVKIAKKKKSKRKTKA